MTKWNAGVNTWKPISVVCHINRIKKNVIISIDTEKTFEITQFFHDKSSQQTRTRRQLPPHDKKKI